MSNFEYANYGVGLAEQLSPNQLGDSTAHSAAHSAMGLLAVSPSPTFSATGKLLTATIGGIAYTFTYDANDNLATSYPIAGGLTRTYTWAIQGDGNYHCIGMVDA